jgi:hypothetical protein
MEFLCQKMAIATIFSTLSAIAMASQPTQAATVFWDLQFLDNAGEQIGTGEFSYDDSAPFEGFFPNFETPDDEDPGDGVFISESDNWYGIQNLTANIGGVTWSVQGPTFPTIQVTFLAIESQKVNMVYFMLGSRLKPMFFQEAMVDLVQ